MTRLAPILLAALLLSAAAAFGEKPNIVYILLDDAGYGDLSCYGQKKFATPHIDALAAGGLRFTRHYAGSTVCAPTRCSLMTGLHTGHCHIRGNTEARPEGQAPLPAGTMTIPKLLKEAGYGTGAFGKWGLGGPGSEGDPVHQGFDEFFGYNCQREAHNYYPDHLWHNRERVPLDGGTYAHDLILERALAFVRAHKGGPFFCFLPVTIPHAALHVPEEDAQPFRARFAEFEKKIGKYAGPEITNPPAAFAGMMTRLDRGIGQLMALLAELGIDGNTIVFLSSDNGPHAEGGHSPDFFESSGGLRGHKRDLYEGGIRVPLIARWPGRIAPGTVSDLVSAHWDLLPTLCDLAGVAPPGKTDGLSFLPTLVGDSKSQRPHDFLYWEFHEQGKKQAVRMGRWKGVRLGIARNPLAPIALYDLEADPAETDDIAAGHADVVEKLAAIMKTEHTESTPFPFLKGTASRQP